MSRTGFDYNEALSYLYGLQKYGIKFGLNKTSSLLKAFGSPHENEKYLHIAGSNGKGSVAVMAASILSKSGLKVGFYSSPHLVRFTERFRIDGREISPERVAELVAELKEAMDPRDPPTFFEVTTAMALRYFAEERTDISVIEVGMGGRLDATNVIRPLVSVITNISLEHRDFLGRSLLEIAGEKAGIIKRGVPVVTGATQPGVLDLFQSICRQKEAALLRAGRDFRYRSNGGGFNYFGKSMSFRSLRMGLPGSFQGRNAALALAVIELLKEKGLSISGEQIGLGLREAVWPGRMHTVSTEPRIILDGAHNPGAAKQLAVAVRCGYKYRRLILVLGIMKDKDISGILKHMVPRADYVLYTRPAYYRAADPEILQEKASALGRPGEIVPCLPGALSRAKAMAGKDDLILVCGSLFTVGEALTCFDPLKYRPDDVSG